MGFFKVAVYLQVGKHLNPRRSLRFCPPIIKAQPGSSIEKETRLFTSPKRSSILLPAGNYDTTINPSSPLSIALADVVMAIAPQQTAAESVVAGEKDDGEEDQDADRAGLLIQYVIDDVEHDEGGVCLHGHGIRGLRE